MITNLTQWYKADKKRNELVQQSNTIEKKLTPYLRELLGKNLIAVRTIYYTGHGEFYFSWNILPDRLPGEELLLLHTDLEKHFFPYVTDVRNLPHQLFIKWTL